MSFDAQINFRATAGYVTDGAGRTYCLDEVYPVTRAGLTFGWDASGNTRDRTTGTDPRLAGIFFISNTSSRLFRLDGLTAGEVQIHVAMGDTFTANNAQIEIRDSDATTILWDHRFVTLAANEYGDAQEVVRASAANWVANEQPRTVTITGTSIYLRIGQLTVDGSNSADTRIAHFRATQPPASSASVGLVGRGLVGNNPLISTGRGGLIS